MPRKKKSGLDYWLENCYRCSNMMLTHYLHDGKDNGYVSYTCKLTGEIVQPWHVDGCKKFDYGSPEETTTEINKKLKNDGASCEKPLNSEKN